MTIYNILFPFLILIALGIAVFILSRRLPEAVEKHEINIKQEKKRWWQILVGKGENLLRILRVLLLKLDNKLNSMIKSVKDKKEKMGENVKDYRLKHRQKIIPDTALENPSLKNNELTLAEKSKLNDIEIKPLSEKQPVLEKDEQLAPKQKNKFTGFSRFTQRMTYVFKPSRFKDLSKSSIPVKNVVPKTFSKEELKMEKQQYWKKKEELLIQSVIREPKNVGLYIQLGRLYSNQRNWEDARNAFLEVLKLDKTNIKAKEELKRIEKYINS